MLDGIDIVVITVGLLALGEVLFIASRIHKDPEATAMKISGRPYLSGKEFREALPAWLRGSAFGLPFGAIPAGGAEIPTFLAFGLERNLDRRRADPQFGTGAIRGLAAPESAANATAGSAMGSLLALGLPTSATAAIMLAAFQQYGMQPGPLLFVRNGELVWALLASLFVGMIVLLVINLPFAPLWAKLLMIPKPYLYAGITVFSALGVYASSGSIFDVAMLIADRAARLRAAPLRAAAGPGADRRDPGAAGRDQPAPRAGDQRRRPGSAVLLGVDHHALLPAATRPRLGRILPGYATAHRRTSDPASLSGASWPVAGPSGTRRPGSTRPEVL